MAAKTVADKPLVEPLPEGARYVDDLGEAGVAVDEVWSALRFRPLKEGESPFTGGR